MRRKYLEQKMAEEQFVTRVTTYPVVASALGQIGSTYEATKQSNSYIRYALETAESGIKTAANHAMPIVNKFEPQVSKLNSLGVAGLSELERKVPAVKEPTDKLLADGKQLYDQKLKPTVDYIMTPVNYSVEKVQNAKDYSVEKVTNVKNYTSTKIQDTKQYGADTITGVKNYTCDKISAGLNSPYGKTVLSGMDKVLDTAEGYVEKYLPEPPKDEAKDDGEETSRMEVAPAGDSNQLTRTANLTRKVRRRLYAKALAELQTVQKRSSESLSKLNFTLDLIQYAQKNIDSGKQKASYYWNEITRLEEEASPTTADKSVEGANNGEQQEEVYTVEKKPEGLEQRAVYLARGLVMQLRRGLAMSQQSYMLPDNVKDKITSARDFSTGVYNNITDTAKLSSLPGQVMEQMKVELDYIQESLSYLKDVAFASKPAEWMGLSKRAKLEKDSEDGGEVDMEPLTQATNYDDEYEEDDDDDDSQDLSVNGDTGNLQGKSMSTDM